MAEQTSVDFLRKVVLSNISMDLRMEALNILLSERLPSGMPMQAAGKDFEIPAEAYKYIVVALACNRKVAAIKMLRQYTGIGFAEAKDAVVDMFESFKDMFETFGAFAGESRVVLNCQPWPSVSLSVVSFCEILCRVREGKRDEAIALLSNATGEAQADASAILAEVLDMIS